MEAYQATGTSILKHPQAQLLLEQTTLSGAAVRGCKDRLTRFMERYVPLFYRKEQRENARIVVEGLISGLERKTCEPIAREHGMHRKPIQSFVGCSTWDDEKVMSEVRRHVKEDLADPNAVLVIDPSAFAKKGTQSCGVKRQWCGRLGKLENCQVGVFLCYAARGGHAPLDRRLYLPEDWAKDAKRREKCHVPPEIVFQEKWRIGLSMLDKCRLELPHGWVAGDDELGRCSEFRAQLRDRNERYVLDVPCNTLIRDLDAPPPHRDKKAGRRGKRKTSFARVDKWAKEQPAEAWQQVEVRPGTKGPLVVEAMTRRVLARDDQRHVGPEERLLVTRTTEAGKPKINYSLSSAGPEVPLKDLVQAHAQRFRIEQMLQEGKGDAGLDHYEVRSWVGWHHHMTLALLALLFLQTERERVGKKNVSRRDYATDPADLFTITA
jgi:SRSO17 transposase